MKITNLLFFLFFCTISAQKILPFDSLKLKEVKSLFLDDYGNVYFYKNKDFSFTKYDSLGMQKGKLQFILPFKIQTVQNPLNIASFSENAQELKYFDQNLVEIQTLNFRQKFGFVKMVYAEDLQIIWLLEESTKRLLQYNFRDERITNSYPMTMETDQLLDFIVFDSKIFYLLPDRIVVYNLKSEKLLEQKIQNPVKLRRENESILIIGQKQISKITYDLVFSTIFSEKNAKIVDKNSNSFLAIKENKLYLYQIK